MLSNLPVLIQFNPPGTIFQSWPDDERRQLRDGGPYSAGVVVAGVGLPGAGGGRGGGRVDQLFPAAGPGGRPDPRPAAARQLLLRAQERKLMS